jgi:SAM-dependent methyltransferase
MAISIFRREAYRLLRGIPLSGRVADLGGSRGAAYHRLFAGEFSVTTVNIAPAARPDIVWDLERAPYPLEDAIFDGVLLINVLEHVYAEHIWSESARILKPGGVCVAVVPFLLPVHPSPRDYFRYTRGALERRLADAGFTEVAVREIGGGAFSAAANLLERFTPPLLRPLARWKARVFDRVLEGFSRALGKKYDGSEYPMGYLVRARKI